MTYGIGYYGPKTNIWRGKYDVCSAVGRSKNSRLSTPLTKHLDDLTLPTSCHFLIDTSLPAEPQADIREVKRPDEAFLASHLIVTSI